MYCRKCGAENKNGSYCKKCGAALSAPISSGERNSGFSSGKKQPVTNKKKKNRWKSVLIAAVCLAAAVFSVILAMKYLPLSGWINGVQDVPDIESDVIHFDDGDYIFVPNEEYAEIDETDNTVYFRNMITVYLNSNCSMDDRILIAESVDGTVVSNISGNINMIDILVKDSDLPEIMEKAEKVKESDLVLDATFCLPVMIEENHNFSGKYESISFDSESGADDKDLQEEIWWIKAIRADTAWNFSDLTEPITVGIVDNGFDTNHLAFQQDDKSIITMLNTNTINYNCDAPEHGTHVAGLIAALDTGNGYRGVAAGSDLICTDFTDVKNKSLITDSFIAKYYEEMIELAAVKNSPIVINNSWGASLSILEMILKTPMDNGRITTALEKYLFETTVRAAKIADSLIQNSNTEFLIVQSSGNGYENGLAGYNTDNLSWFRGITQKSTQIGKTLNNFKTIKEHIIAVGSVKNSVKDGKYQMSSFSNYGEGVDLTAPGEKVISTVLNNQYGYSSGTSMSAPIVSGAAAYVWSLDKTLKAGEVKQVLIETAGRTVGVANADKGKEYPMLDIGSAAISVVKGVASCKVIDAETGTPLDQVVCRRKNDICDDLIFTMDLLSDSEGEIYASAAGHTVFTFEKTGYEPQTVQFDMAKGEEKDLGTISLIPEKSQEVKDPVTDGTDNPFGYTYWVIFTEGYRNDRVEATAVDIDGTVADRLYIVWNTSLEIDDIDDLTWDFPLDYHQYYLDENDNWVEERIYHRFTDWATNIIASNLDIYDASHNKVFTKIRYKDLDWTYLSQYR